MRLAIIAFPSDGGRGGGLSLLSAVVPYATKRGSRVMWVDELYASDEQRVTALKSAGAPD